MVWGLRKGEGYGRIAVNRQGNLQLWEETQLDDPETIAIPNAPASKVPESYPKYSAWMSCDRVVWLRCSSVL